MKNIRITEPYNILQIFYFQTLIFNYHFFENMNYDLTMKLLGYYNSEEQIMHEETRFPEEAIVLANLFKQTFEKTFTNEALLDIEDEDFVSAYYGNTVFIIRDRAGDLYAYYPRENRARLSGVSYGKSTIHFLPRTVCTWFKLGEKIVFREMNDIE